MLNHYFDVYGGCGNPKYDGYIFSGRIDECPELALFNITVEQNNGKHNFGCDNNTRALILLLCAEMCK